jgi:hypothetical protein
MAGPDLTLSLNRIELNVQYVERHDDDPPFIAAATETKTRGAFAELTYSPNGDKAIGTACCSTIGSSRIKPP